MASPTPVGFVTRQNNNLVPCIAIDELPATFDIKGWGRQLTRDQAINLNLRDLGRIDSTHQKFVVGGAPGSFQAALHSLHAPMHPQANVAPDNTLMGSRFAIHTPPFPKIEDSSGSSSSESMSSHSGAQSPTNIPTSPATHPAENVMDNQSQPAKDPEIFNRQRAAELRSSPTSEAGKNLRTQDPKDMLPGRKRYCSYWLRHGECDYAQQGCLYKHEMPLDRDTLNAIGLKDIPKWYREQYGYASLQATEVSRGIADTGLGARILPPTSPPPLPASDWRERRPHTFSSGAILPGDFQALNLNGIVSTRNSRYASPFPVSPPGPPRLPRLEWGHRNRKSRQPWDTPSNPGTPRFIPNLMDHEGPLISMTDGPRSTAPPSPTASAISMASAVTARTSATNASSPQGLKGAAALAASIHADRSRTVNTGNGTGNGSGNNRKYSRYGKRRAAKKDKAAAGKGSATAPRKAGEKSGNKSDSSSSAKDSNASTSSGHSTEKPLEKAITPKGKKE